MKTIYKTTLLLLAAASTAVILSSFIDAKKSSGNTDAYLINIVSTEMVGTNQVWTWTLSNPNPGNGLNGTLQDVSHWSLPLCPAAEAALVSAQYSFDGVTWVTVPISMDRDPSIRLCTNVDVLKFDVGTTGVQPNYYRITFNRAFNGNPLAVSYIKTGGGLKGCNMYIYYGVGCTEVTGGAGPANN